MKELYESIKEEVMNKYQSVKEKFNDWIFDDYSEFIMSKVLEEFYIYDYEFTLWWTKKFIEDVEEKIKSASAEHKFVETESISNDNNEFIWYQVVAYSLINSEQLKEWIDEKFRQHLKTYLYNKAKKKVCPLIINKNLAQMLLNWEIDEDSVIKVLYS